MKSKLKLMIIVSSMVMGLGVANAESPGEREELLGIKNTIVNLIDELVGAGVLDEEKATLMKQRAEAKAKLQAAEEFEEAQKAQEQQKIADEDAVRVQYVPEHVKQEIRDQVRAELKQEVVSEVKEDARKHILGVPNLLPDWVKNLKISGDIRVRNETIDFADDSTTDVNGNNVADPGFPVNFNIVNTNQINLANIENFGNSQVAFQIRDSSRNRFRERLRLGIATKVNDDIDVGLRITTGNIANPVSLNQDLGDDGRRFDLQLDRAFIRYKRADENQFEWLTAYTGVFKNPFFNTELTFDNDLAFQGFAIQTKHSLTGTESLLALEDNSKTLFATFGAFPIDEVELSSDDKWLLGGQLGTEFVFNNQSRFKLAVSYYDFINIRGERNEEEDIAGSGVRIIAQDNDFTAPGFFQGGNTVFDIRNDTDSAFGVVPGVTDIFSDTALYALASDFNLLNLTFSYDWASLAPVHVIFTGDVVKNFGFDRNSIINRSQAGGNAGAAQIFQEQLFTADTGFDGISEETLGYSLSTTIGWPSLAKRGNWQVFGEYRYLERDAVPDAFTNSNFGLGGTNSEGFSIGGRYTILDKTWVQARWFSTDTIDGPENGIDILHLDLNAQF